MPIGGRPLINYIVDKLKSIKEIDEIIVVTNSKFFTKFENWAKDLKLRKRLTIIDDKTTDQSSRRGAVGDMNFTIEEKQIDDDLLVIGGDNLFDGNLDDLLVFARKNNPHAVIGAYDIKKKSLAEKYGVIRLNQHNRIIDFKEKPKVARSSIVAMCLYYFPKEKLGLISQYLREDSKKHDATGFYIDWLRKKEPIYGYVYSGRWYDIGDAKFYHTAKDNFAKQGG